MFVTQTQIQGKKKSYKVWHVVSGIDKLPGFVDHSLMLQGATHQQQMAKHMQAHAHRPSALKRSPRTAFKRRSLSCCRQRREGSVDRENRLRVQARETKREAWPQPLLHQQTPHHHCPSHGPVAPATPLDCSCSMRAADALASAPSCPSCTTWP